MSPVLHHPVPHHPVPHHCVTPSLIPGLCIDTLSFVWLFWQFWNFLTILTFSDNFDNFNFMIRFDFIVRIGFYGIINKIMKSSQIREKSRNVSEKSRNVSEMSPKCHKCHENTDTWRKRLANAMQLTNTVTHGGVPWGFISVRTTPRVPVPCLLLIISQ